MKRALDWSASSNRAIAARDNGILFFPIIPGREEASWKRFYEEGLKRFREDRFDGTYQEELIDGYYTALDSASGAV